MINKIKKADEKILFYISKLQTPLFNKIMVAITTIGNAGTIWLLISVPMLLKCSSRIRGIKLIMSLALAGLMGEIILKRLVGRIRPFDETGTEDLLIKKPTTYSFPSGHSSSSMAAALTISLCFPYLTLPAFTLAFLIAFSRLYLQVHYPSDVVAGATLGILCGIFVNSFCKL